MKTFADDQIYIFQHEIFKVAKYFDILPLQI